MKNITVEEFETATEIVRGDVHIFDKIDNSFFDTAEIMNMLKAALITLHTNGNTIMIQIEMMRMCVEIGYLIGLEVAKNHVETPEASNAKV